MTEFFRAGPWAVTSARVETPKKDFETASTTAVEISRAPLWGAAALLAAVCLAVLALRHILYTHEIVLAVGVAATLAAAASRVGLLTVTGTGWRGTDTGRVWGPIHRLHQVRAAIRDAQEFARRAKE